MDALHRPSVADDKPTPSTFVDGSVSATDPLEVVLDGIGPVAALTLVDEAALAPGDRVRCELAGRRVIVHGIAGGPRGYRFVGEVRFESSGTFRKADYPGLRAIRPRVQGAGGAGGGAQTSAVTSASSKGGGGGAGAYAESFIDDIESLDDEITVTVGAGGTGVSASTGNTGGGSSFGDLVACGGGAGGGTVVHTSVGIGAIGGTGGIATAGDLRIQGGDGVNGWGMNARAIGGGGGSSVLGFGGRGAVLGSDPQVVAGIAGRGYGGGGGGAANSGTASAGTGGAGAPGIVIVELYA